MTSPDSLIASLDSNANEYIGKLMASLSVLPEKELKKAVKHLKETFEASGSEKPLSSKHVIKRDWETCLPVDYRGTMTWSLAYFGSFEIKPETKELPWISDHTSGTVHPDMRTISMLFNEHLTLPEGAKSFVEQSPRLQEEARWERAKATFYSFYPSKLKMEVFESLSKMQVFEALSKMSSRDASRIISKKTSRYENEVILISRPKAADFWNESDSDSEMESNSHAEANGLSEEDAVKLNQEIPAIARAYKESIGSALQQLKSAHENLVRYDWRRNGEEDHGEKMFDSESWDTEFKTLQKFTKECVEACYLSHHFGHAVARYEPRTGWIHLKTQVLYQDSEVNITLPKEIFGVKMFSDYMIRGTPEVQRAAINKQMECFEHALHDKAKGHFLEFEHYHNVPDFYEFQFRIPCEEFSPSNCNKVLKVHLRKKQRFYIVSRPQISGNVQLHQMKVYIEFSKYDLLPYKQLYSGSTLEYVNPFGGCLNCFSKGHYEWACDKRKYGFARSR